MDMRSLKSLVLLIVCLLFAGTIFIGFNLTQTQTQTVNPSDKITVPAPPVVTPSQSVQLTLYYPNAQATGLIATTRTVDVTNQEVIKAMFKELATPPSGLEKPLPQGTSLLSAIVSTDGIATIDLSQEFRKNFGGGSAGEQMTLYSIVNTLTTLSNIHSVQFLINGQKHPGILGHIDTSEPIKRNESVILKSS